MTRAPQQPAFFLFLFLSSFIDDEKIDPRLDPRACIPPDSPRLGGIGHWFFTGTPVSSTVNCWPVVVRASWKRWIPFRRACPRENRGSPAGWNGGGAPFEHPLVPSLRLMYLIVGKSVGRRSCSSYKLKARIRAVYRAWVEEGGGGIKVRGPWGWNTRIYAYANCIKLRTGNHFASFKRVFSPRSVNYFPIQRPVFPFFFPPILREAFRYVFFLSSFLFMYDTSISLLFFFSVSSPFSGYFLFFFLIGKLIG